MAEGTIVQCIGAVVDIEFPRDSMPHIYDAAILEDAGDSLAEKGLTFEVEQQPVAPSQRLGKPVSASVEAAILHCLAKAPADRPTVTSLIDELSQCEPNEPWGWAEAEEWWLQYFPRRVTTAL